ncbi:hypothetical protein D5086_026288 [Populus alba]|uniref:Uncharacterized protein n=1 Tax=Populus alba TaxID=43335 RepID=A0ACC4B1H1_POPAL
MPVFVFTNMTMLYLPFAFWMEYFLRMEKKDVGNIYFTSHDQFKEKKLHEHVLIIVLSQASTVKESSPTCLLDLVKTTIYLSPNQAMAALANERQQDSPLIRHHEMMELPQLHAQSNSCFPWTRETSNPLGMTRPNGIPTIQLAASDIAVVMASKGVFDGSALNQDWFSVSV